VPHHLIDVVDPDEPYTLATYQQQAFAAIERIHSRGRVPLLVGGAGLYVAAVSEGLAIPDVPPDSALRDSLERRAEREGWQSLQEELARVDPVSARRIDPRNVRRVIRALEVSHVTGRPFSEWQTPVVNPFECVLIGLRSGRDALYERIDARIDNWIAGGFVDEVRDLLARGYAPSLPSKSGLGYREIACYLTGVLDLTSAIAQFKHATHQYAKRQMTWFGARPAIHWLDSTTLEVQQVLQLISSM
jgi:tRNA dimethylallyltransferase